MEKQELLAVLTACMQHWIDIRKICFTDIEHERVCARIDLLESLIEAIEKDDLARIAEGGG